MVCECCQKSFGTTGIVQHVRQHSRKCFEYYLEIYKYPINFPYAKKDPNKTYLACECCNGYFCQLSRHLSQYSVVCREWYASKYGDEKDWPTGSSAKNYCEFCRVYLKDPRGKYCTNCRTTHFNVMKISSVSQKMAASRKITYDNDPVWQYNRRMVSKRTFNSPQFKSRQSEYMRNGGAQKALNGVKSVSRPQKQMFDVIFKLYPDAKLEYVFEDLSVRLDIALVKYKIDFEFDGSYWHRNKEQDRYRDYWLRLFGWKVYRYEDRIPTEKEIMDIVNLHIFELGVVEKHLSGVEDAISSNNFS